MHINISKEGAKILLSDTQQQHKELWPKTKPQVSSNIRKKFFTLRVAEHCNRLHRLAMETPLLETFQTHLNEPLCHLLFLTISN